MAEGTALARTDGVTAQFENLARLPVVRQLGLMFGLAASVALGVAVVLWSQEPTYSVLFGGLGQKESAELVEALQQQKVQYKLDQTTGAIMVPSAKVHELRLQLAQQGLPNGTPTGIEVLQQKQEFGTSQFIQTARYQHALEVELARSVQTLSSVESARVHLALPKQSAFIRKRQKASASVLVNLYPGRILEKGQVAAVSHMVASSIPDLEPAEVTVVDQNGNLLSSRERPSEVAASDEHFDFTRKLEESYIRRIEDILTPLVGMDGMRAQVTAKVDFTQTERTSESYNPDLPALRSEQIFEETNRNRGVEGVPGALSNQPPAAGNAPEEADGEGEEGATPSRSVRRSTNNYELDRTISHTRLATGQVERLSVAVVIDDRMTVDEEGQLVPQARPPEEMERITALVRQAVGYDAARGDTVNVINASFTAPRAVEPLPEPPLWQQTWALDLAKQIAGGLLAFILVLMVVRPILKGLAMPRTEEGSSSAGSGGETGQLQQDQLSLSGPSAQTIGQLPKPGDGYEDNLTIAQEMARQDPKHVAQVVRTWVATDEQK